MVFGALLLIFVFVLPGGFIDGLRKLRAKFVTIAPRPAWLASINPSNSAPAEARAVATAASPALADNSTIL